MSMPHLGTGRLHSTSAGSAAHQQGRVQRCSQRTRSASSAGSRTVRAAAQDVGDVATRDDASGAAAAAAGAAATSLIPQTLEEMRGDAEGAATRDLLARRGQAALTRDERRRRQRSLDAIGVPSFQHMLKDRGVSPLRRGAAVTLQLNIGLYCNQACSHCHVESSPLRTEAMDRATAVRCLELAEDALEQGSLRMLDITGGAPELSPQFRYIVECAREIGIPDIIDRCNLTVLLEPGQEGLVDFLARHRVRVAASLPCYSAANVDEQRGGGVFGRSIKGLQMLNAAGYGQPGTGLELDLVYNPNGAFLAPQQATLEEAYRAELGEAYGIVFSRLFALNNMPIKRYVDYLRQRGELETYMETLVNAFNPSAAEGVMCRDTVSVGWDGALYDCDFNQQLALGLGGVQAPRTVFDISSLAELQGRPIGIDNHCFGCTAGSGSGCQGSTS